MNKEKEVKAFLEGKLSQAEKLKYEIADEMGVLDKVLKDGWKSLSAKETGRIGGLMTKKNLAPWVSAGNVPTQVSSLSSSVPLMTMTV